MKNYLLGIKLDKTTKIILSTKNKDKFDKYHKMLLGSSWKDSIVTN